MRYSPDRPLGVAPASATDYRELARRRLPRQLFDYVDGGAYDEATMRANVSDLQDVLLRQVVMRDVSVRDPAVEVLGQRFTQNPGLGGRGLKRWVAAGGGGDRGASGGAAGAGAGRARRDDGATRRGPGSPCR